MYSVQLVSFLASPLRHFMDAKTQLLVQWESRITNLGSSSASLALLDFPVVIVVAFFCRHATGCSLSCQWSFPSESECQLDIDSARSVAPGTWAKTFPFRGEKNRCFGSESWATCSEPEEAICIYNGFTLDSMWMKAAMSRYFWLKTGKEVMESWKTWNNWSHVAVRETNCYDSRHEMCPRTWTSITLKTYDSHKMIYWSRHRSFSRVNMLLVQKVGKINQNHKFKNFWEKNKL